MEASNGRVTAGGNQGRIPDFADDFDPASIWQAIQWTFKKKELQPTAAFTPGSTYRLTLVPWDSQTALHPLNRSADKTDEDDFLADRWFIESAEPAP